MKDFLNKLIAEKEARANELRQLIQDGTDVETVKGYMAEAQKVADELNEARAALAKQANEKRSFDPVATYTAPKQENGAEARANTFAKTGTMTIQGEARSVLVSSGHIATPTQVSGINDGLNGVSSIIDLVKVTNANGMGAYKVAYEDAGAAAATQVEGGAYNNSEPSFNFVTIVPQTEAILSYVSKQVQKQSPLDYTSKVEQNALLALRKRAAKLVTDKLVASALNTKITASAIDATTLRKIALNYGGDDTVVGSATLFLNKKDLVKFGDVRGQNEKKAVYEITPDASNPNTGIIRDGGLSVPYCLDSNLAEGTLAYGQGRCFELALFSPYEIRVSEDFAFDKGLLAIRGDVELGGDVVVKGGFVVCTIA